MKKTYRCIIILGLMQTISLPVKAESAYVSDRMFLGIYAQPNTEGAAIQTLGSGIEVEILETLDGFVKVRTAEGTEGWTRSRFISPEKPATLQLKELQAENKQLQAQLGVQNNNSRAQEVEELTSKLLQAQQSLKLLRSQLDKQKNTQSTESENYAEEIEQLKSELIVANNTITQLQNMHSNQSSAVQALIATPSEPIEHGEEMVADSGEKGIWQWLDLLLITGVLVLGYISGWQSMARKVRRQFNGLKVW